MNMREHARGHDGLGRRRRETGTGSDDGRHAGKAVRHHGSTMVVGEHVAGEQSAEGGLVLEVVRGQPVDTPLLEGHEGVQTRHVTHAGRHDWIRSSGQWMRV